MKSQSIEAVVSLRERIHNLRNYLMGFSLALEALDQELEHLGAPAMRSPEAKKKSGVGRIKQDRRAAPWQTGTEPVESALAKLRGESTVNLQRRDLTDDQRI